MKLSLMSLTALIAAAVVAPGAWGAKPEPAVDEPVQFAAGEVCPFPVLIEPTGENGRTSTARITNTLSGESISVRIAGSATFTTLPNGDERSTSRGQFLQFYFAGDVNGPGFFLAKGRAVDIFDATTGAVTSSHLNGQRIDICAQLS